MGELVLRKTKLKILENLRDLEAENKDPEDTKYYLKAMVHLFEKDLNQKKNQSEEPRLSYFTQKQIDAFQQIGYDEYSSRILSFLCNASHPIANGKLAEAIGFDRSKTYRLVNRLIEDGLIICVQNGIQYFTIANKESPLEPLIKKKENEITQLRSISLA